jgi:hypothetical protein
MLPMSVLQAVRFATAAGTANSLGVDKERTRRFPDSGSASVTD